MITLISFDEINNRIQEFNESPLSDYYKSYPVLRGLVYTLVAIGWEGTPEILSDIFMPNIEDEDSFVKTIVRAGYQCEDKILISKSNTQDIEYPALIKIDNFTGILLEYVNGEAVIYDYSNDKIIEKDITGEKFSLNRISKYSLLFREPPKESRDTRDWVKHCFYTYSSEIRKLMILSFFIAIFGAINPFFIMGIYNFSLPSTSVPSLLWLSLGAITIAIMEYIFKRYRMKILSSSGKDLAIYISFHVTSKLLWIPYAMTATAGVSSQLARLKDIDQFRKLVTADSTLSYFDFPYIIIYIIAILLLSGIAAITVVVGIVAMLLFCIYSRNKYKQETAKNSRANAIVSYQWNEILRNLSSIQGLPLLQGIQTRAKSSHKQSVNDTNSVAFVNNKTQLIGGAMTQVIGTSSIVIAVIAFMEGLSDPSSMIVIIILVWKALSPVMGIYNALTRLKTVQGSSQQIDALMSLADDRLRLEKSPPINHLHGNINVSGISHRYQGAATGLTNIEFKVSAGEKITISGPPGSGKSTLIKIMAGMEANYQGMVSCEGYNIRQFNNFRYRSAVKYIPFNIHFFNETVRDNFNLYNSKMRTADMEIMINNLKLKDYLPEGLDTVLDPLFISKLPSGIKQLLRLAVTLGDIKQGTIFIDEPLMGCSNEFGTLFTSLTSGMMDDKTVIFVTNDHQMIAASDKCLLLDAAGAQKYFGSADKVLSQL
jgi:ABC-type bacteriocin/lantibiotic exporter with double-glycine peptidase domain